MTRREAIASLMALPATSRLSIAKLKPTDVIVLECDQRLSVDVAERLKVDLRGIWPDHKIIVLDQSLKLKIVSDKP